MVWRLLVQNGFRRKPRAKHDGHGSSDKTDGNAKSGQHGGN